MLQTDFFFVWICHLIKLANWIILRTTTIRDSHHFRLLKSAFQVQILNNIPLTLKHRIPAHLHVKNNRLFGDTPLPSRYKPFSTFSYHSSRWLKGIFGQNTLSTNYKSQQPTVGVIVTSFPRQNMSKWMRRFAFYTIQSLQIRQLLIFQDTQISS